METFIETFPIVLSGSADPDPDADPDADPDPKMFLTFMTAVPATISLTLVCPTVYFADDKKVYSGKL